MTDAACTVRFWGVRDHIAVPGPETAVYGGNTPCVEVRCGGALLIFDSGTGIRLLGRDLARAGTAQGDLFFAHTQFDRISGLPFFGAAFVPGNAFRLWAGQAPGGPTLEEVLRRLMTDPIFPVPLEVMRAKLEFEDFEPGATLAPRAGVTLRTRGFNGERPVIGYRVEHPGGVVCYATDIQESHEPNAAALESLVEGADLAILGPETETATGPEPWRWVVERCRRARVGTIVLTNHAQSQDDSALDRLAASLAAAPAGSAGPVLIAREGMVLRV